MGSYPFLIIEIKRNSEAMSQEKSRKPMVDLGEQLDAPARTTPEGVPRFKPDRRGD
jgi:hypothetical protein